MIETERLVLRQWRQSDRARCAAMNVDPEVMAHFAGPLTRREVDADIDWHMARIAGERWGNFAVERRADGAFLGHVGLKPTGPDLPFGGDFEIGWQLARHAWGAGYATEAARAALAYGFTALRLQRIVAFAAATNLRSQAVMARLGMRRAAERDFDHPALMPDHWLARQVVFTLQREDALAG